jgi:hypothetical protein
MEKQSRWDLSLDITALDYITESETCILTYRLFFDMENYQMHVVDLLSQRTIFESWTPQSYVFKDYEVLRNYLFNTWKNSFDKNLFEKFNVFNP